MPGSQAAINKLGVGRMTRANFQRLGRKLHGVASNTRSARFRSAHNEIRRLR